VSPRAIGKAAQDNVDAHDGMSLRPKRSNSM